MDKPEADAESIKQRLKTFPTEAIHVYYKSLFGLSCWSTTSDHFIEQLNMYPSSHPRKDRLRFVKNDYLFKRIEDVCKNANFTDTHKRTKSKLFEVNIAFVFLDRQGRKLVLYSHVNSAAFADWYSQVYSTAFVEIDGIIFRTNDKNISRLVRYFSIHIFKDTRENDPLYQMARARKRR
jgi:hypothetical protein